MVALRLWSELEEQGAGGAEDFYLPSSIFRVYPWVSMSGLVWASLQPDGLKAAGLLPGSSEQMFWLIR